MYQFENWWSGEARYFKRFSIFWCGGQNFVSVTLLWQPLHIVSQKCDIFFNEKGWVILANKELKIRNVDSELLGWLSRLAKEKNISRNELILETLEQLYTLESCQKLYEEQSHQQAQNTKKLKEIASKQSKILALPESVDY